MMKINCQGEVTSDIDVNIEQEIRVISPLTAHETSSIII